MPATTQTAKFPPVVPAPIATMKKPNKPNFPYKLKKQSLLRIQMRTQSTLPSRTSRRIRHPVISRALPSPRSWTPPRRKLDYTPSVPFALTSI